MFCDKISSLVDTLFSDWLVEQMSNRNWSQADLARASGLNRQVISSYINLRRTNPEPDALIAIANALQISPITVFRKAGIKLPKTDVNELVEQIIHETQDMPEIDQQEILAFIRMKTNLRNQRKKK